MIDQSPVRIVSTSMVVNTITDELLEDVELLLMYIGSFIKNPIHKRHSIHHNQARTYIAHYFGWDYDRFKLAYKHLKTESYTNIVFIAGKNPENPTITLSEFGYQYLGYCNEDKVAYDLYESVERKYEQYLASKGYDKVRLQLENDREYALACRLTKGNSVRRERPSLVYKRPTK
jgi:hypothetical protein